MKRPAVFFDRDNTLIVTSGYLGDPAQVKLMPGAADAVARVRKLGFAVVVFSNQSGVARGMFDEDAVHDVNARMESLLTAENAAAIIDRHEFCPFHPEGTVEHYRQESALRKPKPGMIYSAADALALELSESWVIGDAPRDIEAGHAAGCRTILFRPANVPESEAAREAEKVVPQYVVSTLGEAVDYIATHRDRAATSSELAKGKPTEPRAQQAEIATAPSTPEIKPPEPAQPAQPAQTATSPAPSKPIAASIHAPAPAPANPPAAPSAPPAREARTVVPLVQRSTAPKAPESAAAPSSPPAPTAPSAEPSHSTRRLEVLADQILSEIRHHKEREGTDFSVSKLLAGVVQMISLAVLFIAYFRRDPAGVQNTLLVAIFCEALTIALLIMSRQK